MGPCRRCHAEWDGQAVTTKVKGQDVLGEGSVGMEKRKQDGRWVEDSWSMT